LPLELEIKKAARRWYGADRGAPLAYEPSLDDFLSPSLVEAVLISSYSIRQSSAGGWNSFLPSGIGPLAEPPIVADRSDAKQSHLDGLSLARVVPRLWGYNSIQKNTWPQPYRTSLGETTSASTGSPASRCLRLAGQL
jgi:hypothetical protein